MVTGRFGGMATLQWNIRKDNATDTILVAVLALIKDTEIQLFSLTEGSADLSPKDARKIFGNRIESEIRDGKTCLLKLRNLNYSDANIFEFQVTLIRGDTPSKRKRAKIELKVEGMEYVITCYSCS